MGQKTTLVSKNVMVNGRRTSVRLEPELWEALATICEEKSVSVHDVCSYVERQGGRGGFTSQLRVFIIRHLRDIVEKRGQRGARDQTG